MVILINNERKLVTFEIPVPIGGGVRQHVARVERVASSTPSKSIVAEQRVFPTSLTLAAKGTKGAVSAPLPDAVVTLPRIAAALAERRLIKVDVGTADAEAARSVAEKE